MVVLAASSCQSAAQNVAAVDPTSPEGLMIMPTTVRSLPTVRPPTVSPTPLPAAPNPIPLPTLTATVFPTPNPPTPRPTAPSPTPVPPPTTIPGCADRVPAADDLLVPMTKSYGISRAFVPPDLVPISDYFPFDITLGYPTLVREIIIGPLQEMIADMHAAGLEPQIISGYRDYYTQQLAYEKWVNKFPDRADQLSAPPGHSEHQLGTTVDFGSPRLADYIEDEELKKQQFHTHFYMTPEGRWLLDNAHRYGFTLSYPREAIELTGFAYEPWHYRYVGEAMATQLKQNGQTLTEFQLLSQPEPCR